MDHELVFIRFAFAPEEHAYEAIAELMCVKVTTVQEFPRRVFERIGIKSKWWKKDGPAAILHLIMERPLQQHGGLRQRNDVEQRCGVQLHDALLKLNCCTVLLSPSSTIT